MESTGKCKMLWKLSLSVICLLVVFRACLAVHVVNFNQANDQLGLHEHSELSSHARRRRSSETDSERNDEKCQTQKDQFLKDLYTDEGKRLESKHVFINETKFSLALAWAGQDDDGVLIVMTSQAVSMFKSESTIWRSVDFGRTWLDDSAKVGNNAFRKEDGLQRNPHHPKWVYLISYDHFIYVTEDGGNNWVRVDLPQVVREELIFHQNPKYKDYILAITANNQLVMTKDNFKNFEVVRDSDVHKALWGPDDTEATATQMFISHGKENQDFFPFFVQETVTVYELQRRSVSGGSWKTVKTNVVDFGIQGDFLYASIYKNSEPDMNSERLLVVSGDAGDNWDEAQLPTLANDRFFSVLDMSEHLVFMHVDNPGDTGHGTLYTSWSRGIFYSESLERHLYPNFNSITDFYKVDSMRGTYIASQLDQDDSIHSVITFDLGGEWHPLTKPEDVPCKDNTDTCSLQIHNSYSIHRGVKAFPPASAEDGLGLILVTGHAAKNLQTTDPDVYVSSDGGYTWRKALDGPHAYVIADSGGLIVAISLLTPNPQEVKFSTDEGRCWHTYQFTNETIQHTGLLTEPGGKSLTVALWGYRVSDKKWTVHVIDFADVIPNGCTANDYESWQPHETMNKEDASRQGCLLGQRVTYQRLKHDSWCHNGYGYDPNASEQKDTKICPCSKDDFECDYGYYRPNQQDTCVKEPNFSGPEIDVCFRGHREKVISEGYRKLPGDVCNEQAGGFSPGSKYINLTQVCTERIRADINAHMADKLDDGARKGHALLISLGIVVLIVVLAGLAYFGYRMILLRRHKVVYRYSMLNQNDDKDYDREIERTLTGETTQRVFGDVSDEERDIVPDRELQSETPYMNGAANGGTKKSKHTTRGFHDDSDDDMLN